MLDFYTVIKNNFLETNMSSQTSVINYSIIVFIEMLALSFVFLCFLLCAFLIFIN